VTIKQLYQPMGSKQCGQTCVAMIAGVTVEEVVKLIGKKGRTTHNDWRKALQVYGFDVLEKRRVSNKRPFPDLCIAIQKQPGHNVRHAFVMYKGQIYDPRPLDHLAWPITSYVRVVANR